MLIFQNKLFKMLHSCFRCCGCEASTLFVIEVWRLFMLCSSFGVLLPSQEVPAHCADTLGGKTESEVMVITSFFGLSFAA